MVWKNEGIIEIWMKDGKTHLILRKLNFRVTFQTTKRQKVIIKQQQEQQQQ